MPAKSAALKVLLAVLRLGIGVGLLVYLVRSGIIDLRVLPRIATAWPITLAALALLMLDVMLCRCGFRGFFGRRMCICRCGCPCN
jgi:hypothetical protein